MIDFIVLHGLDIFTTILGLVYIWLEYRASIALWIVGIIMPALDIILYWQHGLYGDSAMAVYYTFAALYGYAVWKWGVRLNVFRKECTASKNQSKEVSISHMPLERYLPVGIFFLLAWAATYWLLSRYTNSTVPVLDGFTNALSFVGLWALSRKYIEQWLFWIVVDGVAAYLYIIKGIPFKALLYGLYIFIAVLGYLKWQKMMVKQRNHIG